MSCTAIPTWSSLTVIASALRLRRFVELDPQSVRIRDPEEAAEPHLGDRSAGWVPLLQAERIEPIQLIARYLQVQLEVFRWLRDRPVAAPVQRDDRVAEVELIPPAVDRAVAVTLQADGFVEGDRFLHVADVDDVHQLHRAGSS